MNRYRNVPGRMYTRPQEYGNKADVRWASIVDDNGRGIMVTGIGLINVSAWPFSMDDLAAASHPPLLPSRDYVTFNVDYGQRGVGGDTSWGGMARPRRPYRLEDGRYDYSFVITPAGV